MAEMMARIDQLRERNREVIHRATRTVERSVALARSTRRILKEIGTQPIEQETCPDHPSAGEGYVGVEAIEFRRGTLIVPCMRCHICDQAYFTSEQARIAEDDAAKKHID